jgi:hypothetical protein
MAKFTYTGHRLDEIVLRDLARGAGDLEARAARVLAASQRLVGVDTGRLIASIHRERGTNGIGPYIDIVAGVPGITTYLGYHHFGTGPHVIRARRRKALRFIWHGEITFRRSVRHPGSRGTYFLTRALDAAR